MAIVIIGGGISGLCVAHGLAARGREVVLLEGAPRVGGVIRSVRQQGFLIETGPNGFLDREPALRALIEALGLTGQLKASEPAVRKRFLYTRGALRPIPGSPPAFLQSDILPLTSKL